jgi:hypothetical protein
MWRQGDVFFATTKLIPADATRRPGGMLVEGELTGHSHRLARPETAEVFELEGVLFLRVPNETTVVHQEHHAITLPRGTYRVWGQREYSPEAIRRVLD